MRAWIEQLQTGAQWFGVPVAERTSLQRLAARTLGIVTLGNIATVVGLILTVIGLFLFVQGESWGVFFVGFGRLLDIFDGHLARLTRTSSPLGEGLDAASDKLAIIIAAVIFIDTLPMPFPYLFFAFLVEEVATAWITLHARRQSILLHPSRLGKYSTFGIWTATMLGLATYTFFAESTLLFIFSAYATAITLTAVLVLRWWNVHRIINTIQQARENKPSGEK